MFGVNWPAIDANRSGITELFFGFLSAVMTSLAQGLQFTFKEPMAIAVMGYNMVGNGCRYVLALLETIGA
jgi:hypothetical protein